MLPSSYLLIRTNRHAYRKKELTAFAVNSLAAAGVGNLARRQHADRVNPDALPAPQRSQAHRGPDRSELAPSSNPQPDGTLVKALAGVHRWQQMLEKGE
jgi:hypothetical protein